MKKYLRNTLESGKAFVKRVGGRAAVVVGSTVAAGTAMAQSVGADAAASISGSSADVELVQTALMGILVLLVVFALIRKSLGK